MREKSLSKRDCAMDLMRVVMMFFILNFHFSGGIGREDSIFYGYANGGYGSVGCTMFFMLSGYFLYQNYKDSKFDRKNTGSFYKSHLLRLYAPFYISYLAGYAFLAFKAKNILFRGPISLLIFTLLGIDNYTHFVGVDSLYISIGEWYSTIIILLYILCPLLIFLKKTYKVITPIVIVVLYLLNIYIQPFGISPDASIFTGIFMFYIGMYICQYKDFLKKPGLVHLLAAIFGLLVICIKLPTISGSSLIWKNALGISIFLVLFLLFHIFIKEGRNISVISFLGKISYCVYLVHHFIFYQFFQNIALSSESNIRLIFIYIIYLICTVITATVIWFVSNKLIKVLETKIVKQQ